MLLLLSRYIGLDSKLASSGGITVLQRGTFFYLGAQGHHGEGPLVHSLAAEPSLGGSANITTNLDCTEATR